jgi:pyruvate-formate lyase-activating enzyme
MTGVLRRAAGRVLPDRARLFAGRLTRRVRYELSAALASLRGRAALARMKGELEPFEVISGTRREAMCTLSIRAAQLRRLARSSDVVDAVFLGAMFDAVKYAEGRFRPVTLQSYVDVSVRIAAIRAIAGYVAAAPVFRGDAANVTDAFLVHAPEDRAALLAHAELLLERGAPHQAEPLVRRALRMQAVCQSAQKLLARIEPSSDYDLTDKFCPMPFTHLSTSYKGDAFACCCSAWIPYPIGNVIDAPSADAVWNSPAAIEIRRSIHDGDFKYCSRTLCSYIAARTLPKKSEITDPDLRRAIDERTVVVDQPTMVQLNHDPSCNLACPSCRTDVITAGPEEQRVYSAAAERVLLPLLREMDGSTYISGGGEALASAYYKRILASLNRREYPLLDVYLISNGQLLNAARWADFPNLPEMISILSISIDAARPATYERLRRPGKWNVLMENLELMAQKRADGTIRHLQINFVIQAENFRELPEFIALGTRLGVDSFWLQRLTNYGSYSESVFAQADVTSPHHPQHSELLSVLREPFMNDPRVDMSMLLPLLPEVVQLEEANPLLRVRTRNRRMA